MTILFIDARVAASLKLNPSLYELFISASGVKKVKKFPSALVKKQESTMKHEEYGQRNLIVFKVSNRIASYNLRKIREAK